MYHYVRHVRWVRTSGYNGLVAMEDAMLSERWQEIEQRFAAGMWAAYSAAGKPYGDTHEGSVRWSQETEEGYAAIGRVGNDSGLVDYAIGAAFGTIIDVMSKKKAATGD